jgi:1-acyl-sn-glycerol-3-phosphate acyltransferase
MTDKTPLHARSEAEAVAFALPRDRLPWTIRASNQFGRILIGTSTHVSVAGREHVPKQGALILASNHNSNADPILIANWLTSSLGRPVHWMAKAEAMAWPIAGPFIRMNGAFGIRRGAPDTEAFRLAKSVLDDGRVLGTFPEGTRSPTGALQAGKDGVTLLALRTGGPILPIGVIDTDLFWPRTRKLWKLGGAIRMNVGEPFHLVRGVDADGHKESLEAVTTRLMLHIAALLPPRQQGVYGPLLDAASGAPGGPAGF